MVPVKSICFKQYGSNKIHRKYKKIAPIAQKTHKKNNADAGKP